MANVLVFGVKEAARLACAYLREDTCHEPIAYTVTEDYLPDYTTLDGLPVVPFESVSSTHPAFHHSFLVPMSYRDHNRHRARVYEQVRSMGYDMISYVSPRATVYPGLATGDNSMILEGCVISPGCVIKSNVMIQAGCVIAHEAKIGNHVFLGPGVVLAGLVDIEDYAFVGAGTVVRDKIRLGKGSFIAMGSVVRTNTQPWVNYDGNPARPWYK